MGIFTTTVFGLIAGLLFLFAAATGAGILRGFLKRRKVALGGALIHGAFALTALLMLALSLLMRGPDQPGPGGWGEVAMVVFVLVAIGGGTMVYFHVWHRKLPLWLAFGHAAGGILGILLLWYGLLRGFFF